MHGICYMFIVTIKYADYGQCHNDAAGWDLVQGGKAKAEIMYRAFRLWFDSTGLLNFKEWFYILFWYFDIDLFYGILYSWCFTKKSRLVAHWSLYSLKMTLFLILGGQCYTNLLACSIGLIRGGRFLKSIKFILPSSSDLNESIVV